ncbi:MAG: hypothetical protein P9L98_07100 [Candidatus Kaelpia imicola]|nr:hypothetical protein [Candidatus Kaelpia imicola]
MKTKERVLLYFLLLILVLTKLQYLFKAGLLFDTWEMCNLFIANTIVKHRIFLPSFFHLSVPYAGGGDYLYSLLSAPFVYLFGSNIFSIRILTIFLNMVELSLLFYIVNRYWSWREALGASLLFIFCSKYIFIYSIVGMGRHFHLGLFFLLSLFFYLRFKEKKGYLSAVLFGLSMGIGNYFYPAFAVFISIFILFFLLSIDWKRVSDYLKIFIVLSSTILSGLFYKVVFLDFNIAYTFKSTFMLSTHSPKAIFPIDNIFIIVKRFILFLFFLVPDFLSFNLFHTGEYFNLFRDIESLSLVKAFQEIFNLYQSKSNSLDIFYADLYRVIFILFFAIIISYILKRAKNFKQFVIGERGRDKKALKNSITALLSVTILVYFFLYILNGRSITTYKYYLPLFIPIILALTIVTAWKKSFFLPLLIILLIPGFNFQLQALKTSDSKGNPLMPLYYGDKSTLEFLGDSNNSEQKKLIELNINTAHTLGYILADRSKDCSALRLLAGDISFSDKARRFFWEGWFSKMFLNESIDIDYVKNYLADLKREERFFAFSGIGEALIQNSIYCPDISEYFKSAERDILKITTIEERVYFYQGLGRGLARLYGSDVYSAKGPYIADKRLFYSYLQMVDRDNITDFINGFLLKELWQPL